MSTRKNIFNYLSIAGKLAASKEDLRGFYHGCVAIRKDGKLVQAVNGSSTQKTPAAHAEARVCNKVDVGSIVYVARISLLNGELTMSKPCKNCQNTMRARGVKRCYYSIGPSEYGVMDFN